MADGPSARDRTVARMKKLLLASTMLAACSRREWTSCRGYAVVDPMPPPAGCVGVAGRSLVTAKWKTVAAEAGMTADGGASARVLVVELSVPSDAKADFDNAIMPDGQKLTPIRRDPITVAYEITLRDETATYASFELDVHCSPDASPMGGNGRLSVQLSFEKPSGEIKTYLRDT